MAIPTLVGSGTGLVLTTGTGTLSKATCTIDNLILAHVLARGTAQDWSDGSGVNLKKQNGTAGYSGAVSHAGVGGSRHTLFIGRVTANGTCSFNLTVGASGEDLYARMYEFAGVFNSGVNIGTGTIENGVDDYDVISGTAETSVPDSGVTTNGADRLACNFVAISTFQDIPTFTAMSGGTWTEGADFHSSTGATGTVQLQLASMSTAGTINGGQATVTSTDWGVIGCALVPSAVAASPNKGRNMLTLGVG